MWKIIFFLYILIWFFLNLIPMAPQILLQLTYNLSYFFAIWILIFSLYIFDFNAFLFAIAEPIESGNFDRHIPLAPKCILPCWRLYLFQFFFIRFPSMNSKGFQEILVYLAIVQDSLYVN